MKRKVVISLLTATMMATLITGCGSDVVGSGVSSITPSTTIETSIGVEESESGSDVVEVDSSEVGESIESEASSESEGGIIGTAESTDASKESSEEESKESSEESKESETSKESKDEKDEKSDKSDKTDNTDKTGNGSSTGGTTSTGNGGTTNTGNGGGTTNNGGNAGTTDDSGSDAGGTSQQNFSSSNYTTSFIALLNAKRAEAGLDPVREASSTFQQSVMEDAERVYYNFSHSAVTTAGYCNIGSGHSTIDQIFTGWWNSPGHKAAMMAADLDQVACAMYGNAWVFCGTAKEKSAEEVKKETEKQKEDGTLHRLDNPDNGGSGDNDGAGTETWGSAGVTIVDPNDYGADDPNNPYNWDW